MVMGHRCIFMPILSLLVADSVKSWAERCSVIDGPKSLVGWMLCPSTNLYIIGIANGIFEGIDNIPCKSIGGYVRRDAPQYSLR